MKPRYFACLAALLVSTAAAFGDNVTLTIVTNPPNAGTATGAGVYPHGSQVQPVTQASNGWYITNISSVAFLIDQGNIRLNGGDISTITNFTDSIIVNSDTTYTVTFAPLSPTFTATNIDTAAFPGNQVILSNGATGRQPMQYGWRKGNVAIPGATNATLVLTNVQPTNSGAYTVTASNAFGTNSFSANLVVRDLLVFANGKAATNAVTNLGFVEVTLQSRFTNGLIFYTLDGSTPSAGSAPYSDTFFLSTSATVRAIGYSSDFLQTVYSDPIPVTVIPTFTVSVNASSGGTVSLNPPGGVYTNGTVVTIVATPDPGSVFMGFADDSLPPNSTNIVTITNSLVLTPKFGGILSNTAVGNGTIVLSPNFPVYPYWTPVRVTAVPAPGSYLAAWGGGLSGAISPNYLTFTPPPTAVSALFASLPAGKTTLTLFWDGNGSVDRSSLTNLFATSSNVTLTASPNPGETFLGWSGDASGTNTPLTISMTQSRTVTAHFSSTSTLSLFPSPGAVSISLSGTTFTVYRIDVSSNLATWTPLLMLTNFGFSVPPHFSDPVTNAPERYYRAVAQ